ncbi:hypothetical protein LSAT2_015510 [Lamellibrachia satsuma]|nr:hypothetical protein LSAT2_015510 [Lamellibrachia satsuma]
MKTWTLCALLTLLTLALFIDCGEGINFSGFRWSYMRRRYDPTYRKCNSRAEWQYCSVICQYKGCRAAESSVEVTPSAIATATRVTSSNITPRADAVKSNTANTSWTTMTSQPLTNDAQLNTLFRFREHQL